MPTADAPLTTSLLHDSAMLGARLVAAMERSRDLVWRGHRRRLAGDPRIHDIGGSSGDDAGLVTLALTGSALCVDCLARKTGLPKPRVELLLITVDRTLRLTSGVALCDSCLNAKKIFRLA